MKARILKHKTKIGCHGLVRNKTLYVTGTHIVPDLFPPDKDIVWIDRSIDFLESSVVSLHDFDLVDVEIVEIKS